VRWNPFPEIAVGNAGLYPFAVFSQSAELLFPANQVFLKALKIRECKGNKKPGISKSHPRPV